MPGFPSSNDDNNLPDIPTIIEDTPGPEPIAIIGIGCRLPGNVSSAAECWEFLKAGKDSACEFPKSRFNIDAFHSKRKGVPGTLPMRGGYFLQQDIRQFDNGFFGINNLEATHMDPQQRNLLEVVYECLESAGVKLEDVAGSNVGCYVGDFVYDFLVMQAKDDEEFHRYSPTGKGRTILSNRISHAFDFRGPSMTLDTACSSSLYCLHLACRALLQGDCDAAVVASANLIQTPEQQMDVAASGVLSPTSTCHTFDAAADGYGRADAVGALYLKRLSDAIRDNDPIRTIIRGTSANSNGQTPGITLPSAKCQEAVIDKAYQFARINLRHTDYFECHGTGTPVGDPIEVSAVAQARRKAAISGDAPSLLIGSTKPSFGHSEAASGICSIIKATLALEHLQIPPTVGIKTLNPNIPWEEHNLKVVQSLTAWPRSGPFHVPRISINSFGYGGANAHCILDNANAWIEEQLGIRGLERPCDHDDRYEIYPELDEEQAFILPFSAKDPEALINRIKSFSKLEVPQSDLSDLAYTLSQRRSALSWRGFVVTRPESWQVDLTAACFAEPIHISDTSVTPLTFIFTGQGAQWPSMGKRLFEAYSEFRSSILRSEYHLLSLPNAPIWSLSDVVFNNTEQEKINQPAISQTACTAIQIGLVDLLRQWGITPHSVIGHSSGEIGAAYAAGHISATFAIEVAYLRGQVVTLNAASGAMMALSMSYDNAQELIKNHKMSDAVHIACHNSPQNVTLSGDAEAIDVLHQSLRSTGTFARKLKTGNQAYHSHHMHKLGARYEALLRKTVARHRGEVSNFSKQFRPQVGRSQATMISTVLGREVDSTDTSNPAYWRANLESPVLFNAAVETIVKSNPCAFVEIGPHHALQVPVQQIQASLGKGDLKVGYLSALVRSKDSEMTALSLAGTLWAHGYTIDLDAIGRSYRWSSGTTPKVLHDLPNYPWDHSKILWKEPRVSLEYRHRKFPRDELIGSIVPASNGRTYTWRGLLDIANVPWLIDHKLSDNVVLPGACYISMATRACQQLLPEDLDVAAIEIRHLEIEKVMLLHAESKVEVMTELRPLKLNSFADRTNTWEFIISSNEDDRYIRHASGHIEAVMSTALEELPPLAIERPLQAQESKAWYSRFKNKSLNFGPAFQSLERLSVPRQRDEMSAIADVTTIDENFLNEQSSMYPFDMHPIATDAAFQTGLVATASGELENLTGRVPVSIERLQLFRSSTDNRFAGLVSRATARLIGPGSAMGQCQLLSPSGQTVFQAYNIKVTPLQETEIQNTTRTPMLQTKWTPDLSKVGEHNINALDTILGSEEAMNFSRVEAIVKLKASVTPELNVLVINHGHHSLEDETSSHPYQNIHNMVSTYTEGLISEGPEVFCQNRSEQQPVAASKSATRWVLGERDELFDVIIIPDNPETHGSLHVHMNMLRKRLRHSGIMITPTRVSSDNISDSGVWVDDKSDTSDGLTDILLDDMVMVNLPFGSKEEGLSLEIVKPSKCAMQAVIILANGVDHPLNKALLNAVISINGNSRMLAWDEFEESDISSKATVVVTAELHRSLTANVSAADFTKLQLITNAASKILWLSGGNLVDSIHPEYYTTLGLARSVMAGNPSIQFMVLDIDTPDTNISSTVTNVRSILEAERDSQTDMEFMQKDGLLYVSRLVLSDKCNEAFEQKKKATAKNIRLSEAASCELHIQDPGQFDTLEFKYMDVSDELASDHVEVSVRAVGMNAKDLYTLTGKVDTIENTCSCEFAGIIISVGSEVDGLAVGDRVISSAPGRYRPTERVPASVCIKMTEDEEFSDMACVPMVYGTAIHALRNLANLQKGESVLIHSAAGGVGTAAILLAQKIGAIIYATVGNDKKKTYLVDQFGLQPEHIFNSRDTSFLPAILKATNGVGVDVILNSLTGSRLHASLDACAKFGRFIEIGKRDILDAGNMNMRVFSKGITFSAFDLHELYYSENSRHRRTYEQLLIDAVSFHRSLGYTSTITTCFDIGDIGSAFRYFANASRIGKVAITYDDPSSLIPVVPPKFTTRFSADKSYLLVGCLGGLGRSISKYMLQNGARNFTFLGRTGDRKEAAATLVSDLRQSGANIKVITGDVCSLASVEEAVASLSHPLGGVIQAAMGLSEALFPAMTHSAWHTALDPKVRGTQNIHQAIVAHEQTLDFFLLTSSIAGTIGFSTESNYCAANCFLDHFAAWRREQGLKACSVALGPVAGAGIVHEHPEIENVFFRGGITEVTEDDMLCIIDVALSQQDSIGHVITGLEPSRAKAGFEDSWEMLAPDPRLAHITAAHRRARAAKRDGPATGSTAANGSVDGRILAALKPAAEAAELENVLHDVLSEQLAKLVLMEAGKIGRQMYLSDVGMDSTLAAQFRTYVFRSTGVDVSFVVLMDGKTRMEDVARFVKEGLKGAEK